MMVFGGEGPIWYLNNDVWALTLGGSPAWTSLASAGSAPSARAGHTAIYDPVRDRMVVFGGWNGGYFNDVWALSLAGSPEWTSVIPAGSPPPARNAHTAIYDPARDRMVMFAGWVDGIFYALPNDVWALSLAGTPAWTLLAPTGSPPPARYVQTAIHDPVRDRMVVFGGADGEGGDRGDVWLLEWNAPVSVPGYDDALRRRFDLARPRPNPSRGETTVDFELGEPARVVLDVFDAQGRRVRRIVDQSFTAGPHVCTWRGDDDRGHSLGSGVYFIRMQSRGFEATRRIVRVR
jgi:hypothetical protein